MGNEEFNKNHALGVLLNQIHETQSLQFDVITEHKKNESFDVITEQTQQIMNEQKQNEQTLAHKRNATIINYIDHEQPESDNIDVPLLSDQVRDSKNMHDDDDEDIMYSDPDDSKKIDDQPYFSHAHK